MKRPKTPWLSACVACLGSGCSQPLQEAECFDLLDKYVELIIQSDSPEAPPSEMLKLKQEARLKAARDPAFAECKDRVSRTQFQCAMRASNPDGLEQCLL